MELVVAKKIICVGGRTTWPVAGFDQFGYPLGGGRSMGVDPG
ncbi:hypothetical protein A2U01_0030693, partial [Trifolium medium]|nr:hypothetical protein [Trifolium medium]